MPPLLLAFCVLTLDSLKDLSPFLCPKNGAPAFSDGSAEQITQRVNRWNAHAVSLKHQFHFTKWRPLTGQAEGANSDHWTYSPQLFTPIRPFHSAQCCDVCVGVCARTCTQIAIYSSFQINDVQDSTAIPPAQKYAQTIIDPSQSVEEPSRIHHECCTLSEVLKTKLATLVKGVVGVISSSSSHWHSRNTWAFGACLDLLVVQSLCMDFIVGKRILNILSPPPKKKSDQICMLILQW